MAERIDVVGLSTGHIIAIRPPDARSIRAFTAEWDKNGNIAANDAGNDITYTFNWDNKLRKAEWPGNNSIELKYDPLGNRVYKKSTASGSATERKYVLDVTGDLPVILMDLNLTDSSLKKKYVYADRQILAQDDIDDDAQPARDDKYFYVHDRLWSVRLILADNGSVVKHYTYEPFGELIDEDGTYNVFFGTIESYGVVFNTGIGMSVGFSFGFSENAQCPEDLAGPYCEVGLSVSLWEVGFADRSHSKGLYGGADIKWMTGGLGFGWPPVQGHVVWGEGELGIHDSWTD